MPNYLAHETSPYLLQHVDNPVDWHPWGEKALSLSQEQDKPIFLSIGYAACHWCHVMAHESFEDQETAELMNRYFVNIKVDREERPDLDSIYMSAVQALTGQGGWPMSVFLTPQGNPFYGGTYYPPVPRFGMPSFKQLLVSIAETWQTKREEIENSAGQISTHLSQANLSTADANPLDPSLFEHAYSTIRSKFDAQEGGFGEAPKFPPSMTIEFLLRYYLADNDPMALHMAEFTLAKMAYSGMYDQLGGGFARYATDDKWLVPHFEKMLYDNALLSRVYLHAFQVTGNPLYRRIVEETLDFVVKELRHEDGGFYSSYDADSEGEEGKFYVWQPGEIRHLLGSEADLFLHYYDVTENGNWEGKNILNVKTKPQAIATQFDLEPDEMSVRLRASRQKLYEARAQREWPGLDDKVLTAWNGLMLASFAEAGRILARSDYSQIATKNAEFLYTHMRRADGRLLRTWKTGSSAKYNAYLEDYTYLADGLLALYQSTFETRWYVWAQELTELMLTHFSDQEEGGFFDTSNDHESLLYRPKDVQDNATPSANAMAAHVLLKLSMFTGSGDFWDEAQRNVSALSNLMSRFPTAFAHWLCAASFILGEPQEVAITGDLIDPDTQALVNAVYESYHPNLVVAAGREMNEIPLMTGRQAINGKPAAYVCRRFVCHAPVTESQDLIQQLN
jgi:uncharacterized protein YyaL (SSP411 family)